MISADIAAKTALALLSDGLKDIPLCPAATVREQPWNGKRMGIDIVLSNNDDVQARADGVRIFANQVMRPALVPVIDRLRRMGTVRFHTMSLRPNASQRQFRDIVVMAVITGNTLSIDLVAEAA